MSLPIREYLRLSPASTEAEVIDTCKKYAAIYRSIIESSADRHICAIAEKRLADLVQTAREDGITCDFSRIHYAVAPTAHGSSCVEEYLNTLNGVATESQVKKLSDMISELPDGPQKNYFRFILKSFLPASQDRNKQMYQYITSALAEDPDNIVYQTLSKDICEANQKYEEAYNAWEAKQAEEIRNEKKVEVTKAVFSKIGTVIGAIVIGIGAFLGFLLECLCDSCDC